MAGLGFVALVPLPAAAQTVANGLIAAEFGNSLTGSIPPQPVAGPGILHLWYPDWYPTAGPGIEHDIMWYGTYDYVGTAPAGTSNPPFWMTPDMPPNGVSESEPGAGKWADDHTLPMLAGGTLAQIDAATVSVTFAQSRSNGADFTVVLTYFALPAQRTIRVTADLTNTGASAFDFAYYHAEDVDAGGVAGAVNDHDEFCNAVPDNNDAADDTLPLDVSNGANAGLGDPCDWWDERLIPYTGADWWMNFGTKGETNSGWKGVGDGYVTVANGMGQDIWDQSMAPVGLGADGRPDDYAALISLEPDVYWYAGRWDSAMYGPGHFVPARTGGPTDPVTYCSQTQFPPPRVEHFPLYYTWEDIFECDGTLDGFANYLDSPNNELFNNDVAVGMLKPFGTILPGQTRQFAFYIGEPPSGRDLVVTSADITVEPDYGSTYAGTPQWINATVWNYGTVDITQSFDVQFTIGGPPDANDDGLIDPGITVLGSATVTNTAGNPLPSFGSKPASFLWSNPPVGIHDLWVVVDYPTDGAVDEINLPQFEILNNRAKYDTSTLPAGSAPPLATAPPEYQVFPPPLDPPRNVRTAAVGSDVQVTWQQPIDPSRIEYYEVYGGPTPVSINLVTPIGQTPDAATSSWTDLGRASGAGEFYYVVRSVNGTINVRSETSNTAGAYTAAWPLGLSAISLPLQPYTLSEPRLGDFLAATGANTVQSLDATGIWQPVTGFNTPLIVGEVYLIDLPTPTTYTFVGFPGAHIRYREGFGFAMADRDDARVLAVGSDAALSWPAAAGAASYLVLRSDRRDGFFFTEGVDYTIAATVASLSTTVAGGAASESYYMVVPVDGVGNRGASSYSVGLVPLTLAGHDGFGLPLRPFLEDAGRTADDFTAAFGAEGVMYFVPSNQVWVPHSNEIPFGVYDPVVAQAVGYQTTVNGSIVVFFRGH